MIELNNVKKSYGLNEVLDIENLKLSEGVFWVSGENGSGKSTLIQLIAGILDFDGDVILDEKFSLKHNPINFRRLVNFAEAEPVFPDFVTGKDLIKLFVSAKSATPDQEEYFVDKMNMTDYLSEPVGTYSSGMLKKLSLVLAFLGNPKLVLLDEPLTTIDSKSLHALYGIIRDMYIERNVSFILSSHQHIEQNVFPIEKIMLKDGNLKFQ